MRKPLSDFSDEPVYNMKAVEQQTGISAATLRAWERRYALVEPKRTASGYRLYSDHDIALLRWVRVQMDEGLTISRVVAMLTGLQDDKEAIWIEDDDNHTRVKLDAPIPPGELSQALVQACSDLDEDRADEIMEQAYAIYTMPTVYVEVIAPALAEIDEERQRSQILGMAGHFAVTYLRGRLHALLQAYTHYPNAPIIFVGCAPGERYEIGPLIFAVMMRQQGYNVVYFGQDFAVDDMVRVAAREHPAMVYLSATSMTTALALRDVQARLAQIESPTPLFGYGGSVFDQDNELRRTVGGHFLSADPRDALNVVNNLLRNHRHI
jgi:MerR family transcriptional regulator, light-induced transcriptional regulator